MCFHFLNIFWLPCEVTGSDIQHSVGQTNVLLFKKGANFFSWALQFWANITETGVNVAFVAVAILATVNALVSVYDS